ncbi:MAG TPA: 4Fe-4S dicluster domain-containing protein [Symbiobacteriaceae bacterium]|nr:4Fe-4S dicluster domain-containing protein [Symbiobacteriaceae bacterium]
MSQEQTPRYGMVIDLRQCIGCYACTVSCKSENQVPLGVFRTWVKEVEVGAFPNVSRHFLPWLCNQCEDPVCVRNCPVGATYKRADGITVIAQDECIGCRYCIASCPYGARFINPETNTASKCDFCVHRVEQGLVPSCVNTCVGRARVFGDLNDPESEISKLIARTPTQVLKPEAGTEPRVFYIGADTRVMTGGTNQ